MLSVSREFEDALAGFIAWVVIIVVPLLFMALFIVAMVSPAARPAFS